jgi:hypothetical protein
MFSFDDDSTKERNNNDTVTYFIFTNSFLETRNPICYIQSIIIWQKIGMEADDIIASFDCIQNNFNSSI